MPLNKETKPDHFWELENRCIHAFRDSIGTKLNANSLIQGLNLGGQFPLQRW